MLTPTAPWDYRGKMRLLLILPSLALLGGVA